MLSDSVDSVQGLSARRLRICSLVRGRGTGDCSVYRRSPFVREQVDSVEANGRSAFKGLKTESVVDPVYTTILISRLRKTHLPPLSTAQCPCPIALEGFRLADKATAKARTNSTATPRGTCHNYPGVSSPGLCYVFQSQHTPAREHVG